MFENMFQHLVFLFHRSRVFGKSREQDEPVHSFDPSELNRRFCTRHKSDDRMTIRGVLYKVTCDAGRPQKLQRRAERCEIVNKFVEIDTNK